MAETMWEHEDWHDRRHRHDGRWSWIVGVILILLGAAFLLQQAGFDIFVGNWWTIFIYLLAVGSFYNMWRAYRASGSFGGQATASLTWGLVLAAVATIFLLDLAWSVWWPSILIVCGAGILIGELLRAGGRKSGGATGR